jgi:hypothetical protein
MGAHMGVNTMKIRVKAMLVGAAFVAAAGVTTASAQVDLTAYHYVYYADAAKTEYLGEVSDRGCRGSGNNVYVIRANVPSPYYDATPIYVCGGNGPQLPDNW